jgi:hypothetical protein
MSPAKYTLKDTLYNMVVPVLFIYALMQQTVVGQENVAREIQSLLFFFFRIMEEAWLGRTKETTNRNQENFFSNKSSKKLVVVVHSSEIVTIVSIDSSN